MNQYTPKAFPGMVVPPSSPEMNQGCDIDMSRFPIGMAYVPWQKWRDIYDADTALKQGTIFKELDLPFGKIGGNVNE